MPDVPDPTTLEAAARQALVILGTSTRAPDDEQEARLHERALEVERSAAIDELRDALGCYPGVPEACILVDERPVVDVRGRPGTRVEATDERTGVGTWVIAYPSTEAGEDPEEARRRAHDHARFLLAHRVGDAVIADALRVDGYALLPWLLAGYASPSSADAWDGPIGADEREQLAIDAGCSWDAVLALYRARVMQRIASQATI